MVIAKGPFASKLTVGYLFFLGGELVEYLSPGLLICVRGSLLKVRVNWGCTNVRFIRAQFYVVVFLVSRLYVLLKREDVVPFSLAPCSEGMKARQANNTKYL